MYMDVSILRVVYKSSAVGPSLSLFQHRSFQRPRIACVFVCV